MLRKSLRILLLAGLPLSAQANVVAGIDYTHIFDENDIGDFDGDEIKASFQANLVKFSVGYQHYIDDKFSILPRFRYGTEAGSSYIEVKVADLNEKTDVDVDSFISFSVRGQYDIHEKAYLFAEPSYSQLDYSETDDTDSYDDWEVGLAVGAGYHAHKNIAGEISYEQSNGFHYVSLGVNLYFDLNRSQ